jgi:hypothetical protein
MLTTPTISALVALTKETATVITALIAAISGIGVAWLSHRNTAALRPNGGDSVADRVATMSTQVAVLVERSSVNVARLERIEHKVDDHHGRLIVVEQFARRSPSSRTRVDDPYPHHLQED